MASRKNLSCVFPTRSDTNRAVQPQKRVGGLKFRIKEVEGLYYLCSKNKGADQLRGHLRLCFSHLCINFERFSHDAADKRNGSLTYALSLAY